jgi:CheY-like chemotaxis protein
LQPLEVLHGDHGYLSIDRPLIVLLDLNMPRMDGFEFLRALRTDQALQDLVVFVLSTSEAETDRSRAYHENIAGYVVKSSVGSQFGRLARLLLTYQTAVTLP